MGRAAFLSAIRNDPTDDGPRLVYADWLDDEGQPDRAAFIRTQIDADHYPEYDPLRLALAEEADDLLALHGDDWRRDDLGYLDGCSEGAEFRRGFVDSVVVRGPLFHSDMDPPGPLRHAAFHAPAGGDDALLLAEMARSVLVPWLASLELRGPSLTAATVRLLAPALEPGRLRELTLYGTPFGVVDSGLAALAELPALAGLRSLSVARQPLDGRLWQLLDSPHLTGLETLRLDDVFQNDSGLRPANSNPLLLSGSLHELQIRRCGLGDDSLRHLAECWPMADLTALDLSSNR